MVGQPTGAQSMKRPPIESESWFKKSNVIYVGKKEADSIRRQIGETGYTLFRQKLIPYPAQGGGDWYSQVEMCKLGIKTGAMVHAKMIWFHGRDWKVEQEKTEIR